MRDGLLTARTSVVTLIHPDAAEKRKNKVNNGSSGRLSRANSESESESPNPAAATGPHNRDYGTIVANSGVSTPRRRPSGPHRLGTVNSTTLAFDKVKIKGTSLSKRKETLEAVRQNLEAIGNSVVELANTEGEREGEGDQESALPRTSSSVNSDTGATIRPDSRNGRDGSDEGGDEADGEGEEASESSSSNTRRLTRLTRQAPLEGGSSSYAAALAKNLEESQEADENAPLLGGKTIAGSPSASAM